MQTYARLLKVKKITQSLRVYRNPSHRQGFQSSRKASMDMMAGRLIQKKV